MTELNSDVEINKLIQTKVELNNIISKGKPDGIDNNKWLKILDDFNKIDKLINLIKDKRRLLNDVNKINDNIS